MDYDSILKIVMGMKERKNDNDDRTCYICHFPIKQNEKSVKLKCKHNYHSSCLDIRKKSFIKCPYCLTITKNPIVKKKKDDKKECQLNKCNAILKYGKNKGKKCGKINCKRHKNQCCQTILKSGKRKGEKCNRINCCYHNKKNIVV
jgi:hypothetical protein